MTFALVAVACLAIGAQVPSSPAAQPGRSAQPVATPSASVNAATIERGRSLTQAFYKGQFDTVWGAFSPRMQSALGSVANLRSLAGRIEADGGSETAVLEERVETAATIRVYLRIARFSRTSVPVLVQWAFGPDNRVDGFYVRPVPREAASDRLDYVAKAPLKLPFTDTWFVVWGGRTPEQNYHAISADQRFAYDFLIQRGGSSHTGSGQRNRNEDYYAFGQKVLAPAGATVVRVVSDLEDNVPGTTNPLQPFGNHVILDHGNAEFSVLAHFKRGSLLVKAGQAVKAGEVLGLVGNSGNSSEPHLHYHLQDVGEAGKGRGLPAPFSGYSADGKPVTKGEPLGGQVIKAN